MSHNKTRIRTMIEDVWNGGHPDRLSDYWIEETRAEAEGLHRMLTDAFPDLHLEIEDLVGEGDRVVARLTFSGTHEGVFQGIAPTGRAVQFGGIRIYRLEHGKVAETWAHQDAVHLMRQLTA